MSPLSSVGQLVARATAVTAALTLLGSLLGLARDLLLARFYGASADTDAFLVAWTVPETASPLLIEGAMALVMIPVFVRAVAAGPGLAAVVRATLPRLVGGLALAAAAVVLAAPWLVRVLAPGITQPDLAVTCTRVAAVTVVAFGVAGYLGAALRSVHSFGPAAAIYVAYNVGIIASMLLLHQALGVLGVAVGLAMGSLLMVAVQVPAFVRVVRRPVSEAVAARAVGTIAVGAFVPVAVYTLIRQGQVFVERHVGSDLVAGTISQLNYAQKVAQVPMVLSIMVATVTFPLLARSAVTGDEAAARRRTTWDLQAVGAVALAATAYLVAYAPAIIGALFEQGRFTPADTAATAAIMRVYSLGLLGQAVVVTLARSHYSSGRATWYPALAMGVGLAVTAAVAVAFTPLWGVAAIAAANAIGISTTAVLLGRGRGLDWAAIGSSLSRLGLAALAAGVAGAAVRPWLAAGSPAVEAATGALVVAAIFGAVVVASDGRARSFVRLGGTRS